MKEERLAVVSFVYGRDACSKRSLVYDFLPTLYAPLLFGDGSGDLMRGGARGGFPLCVANPHAILFHRNPRCCGAVLWKGSSGAGNEIGSGA